MEDERKTKKQLIAELNCLRQEQIEQTKIISEKFTKAFLQNSVPMIITTMKEGIFIDVSDAFLRLLDCKRDEVIGLTSREAGFITDEQRANFYNEFGKNGCVENLEMELIIKGKVAVYGLFNAVMISIKNENYMLTTIQDITNRKQAEQNLQRCNERLEEAQKIAKIGDWEANLLTDKLYWSPVIFDIFGLDAKSFKPSVTAFYNAVHPEDRELVLKSEERSEQTGLHDVVHRIIRPDGEIRFVHELAKRYKDHQGKLIRLIGTVQDITDLKLADEALSESEDKYRTLVENINEVIFTIDIEGRITYLSPVFEKYSSCYKVSDLIGKNFAEFIHPDDLPGVMESTNRLLQQKTETYEYRIMDGDKVRHVWSSSQLIMKDGVATGARGILTDNTERKQAEAQIRQLQKSDSLGRMASSIAHYFNNHLGVVIGNLEMALLSMPEESKQRNKIIAAKKASQRVAEMSGLMLTYIGQSANILQPLDISDACRSGLTLLLNTMPTNVFLINNLSSPGPIIMGNSIDIHQILTNLVTNAREAIGNNKGTINLNVYIISGAEIPTACRRPVEWQLKHDSYACMEVRDTGSGIEDEDMEKLFDPFFSSKFIGRGMGLAVVEGILKAYNGVITVESKPKRGSTFRVIFPLCEKALYQPVKTDVDRKALTGEALQIGFGAEGTVLLAEDEDELRATVAEMLENMGFFVIQAKDGVEAMEFFVSRRKEIKFVLTDLTMPRMNGWEVLTELRKLQPDIPVILASGYDISHVMEGDHPELPQAFLGKPYNLKALNNAIHKALDSGNSKG